MGGSRVAVVAAVVAVVLLDVLVHILLVHLEDDLGEPEKGKIKLFPRIVQNGIKTYTPTILYNAMP